MMQKIKVTFDFEEGRGAVKMPPDIEIVHHDDHWLSDTWATIMRAAIPLGASFEITHKYGSLQDNKVDVVSFHLDCNDYKHKTYTDEEQKRE